MCSAGNFPPVGGKARGICQATLDLNWLMPEWESTEILRYMAQALWRAAAKHQEFPGATAEGRALPGVPRSLCWSSRSAGSLRQTQL